MQLVAYGAQDIYLTGNPQITFFKVVYRRHTNFAMEAIGQTLNGNVAAGKTVTTTISRNGDLVGRTYCEVSSSSDVCPANFGAACINNVVCEIGGQQIDKHYGDWMEVWAELTEPNTSGTVGIVSATDASVNGTLFQTMAKMGGVAGGTSSATGVVNATVPLQFWFCRNPGLALPLIALQYHEVKLKISFSSVAGTGTNFACEVWSDYIYLDTDERRRFAQVSHEYLIEQVQNVNTSSTKSHNLTFNHPVKELVWTGSGSGTSTTPPTSSVLGPFTFDTFDSRGAGYGLGDGVIVNGIPVAYYRTLDFTINPPPNPPPTDFVLGSGKISLWGTGILNLNVMDNVTNAPFLMNGHGAGAGYDASSIPTIVFDAPTMNGYPLLDANGGFVSGTPQTPRTATALFKLNTANNLGELVFDMVNGFDMGIGYGEFLPSSFTITANPNATTTPGTNIQASDIIAGAMSTLGVVDTSSVIPGVGYTEDVNYLYLNLTDVNGNNISPSVVPTPTFTYSTPASAGVAGVAGGVGGATKLVLNGHDRMHERPERYFTQTQIWQHHTGAGGLDVSAGAASAGAHSGSIAVYSFALKPEEHQPSGTCNFSRIDNAQLKTDTSTSLNIYAVNYNVLRVMSGMGGLAYSN